MEQKGTANIHHGVHGCPNQGNERILLSKQMENHQMPLHLAPRLFRRSMIPLSQESIWRPMSTSKLALRFILKRGTGVELIKNTEGLSVYKAKSEGKNTFALFTCEMHETLWQRKRQEDAMRARWKYKKFTVFSQPEIARAKERAASLEALIHWQKDGQRIGQDDFIPLAEQSALIEGMSFSCPF